MTVLHVVLPDAVDDPRRPSGGNRYDRRVCDGLAALGWSVREHVVTGEWPDPDAAALKGLDAALAAIPERSLVLVDGLVSVPDVLLPQAARLRLVVLVHLPLGLERTTARPGEARLLRRCAVVTTSEWTRDWLLAHYALEATRVRVVTPGVDGAEPASGTPTGGALLVVGPVTAAKGYDVLAVALAGIADLVWRCLCVGSLETDPDFGAALRERLRCAGLADRVELRGARPPAEAWEAYAAADLVVLPSRLETYGMVVTEALAHGVPVLASAVGGVAEAMGHDPEGRRPGLLVHPGDGAILGRALRWWLTDAGLRADLRAAARLRRTTLTDWPVAASRLAAALRHPQC